MMDWTDSRCRVFHRSLSRHAALYTEMVTAAAVIHGPRDRLLGFAPVERPLTLQLGGSDPAELGRAARIAAEYGYDEINLNVGCPSDRVQSGCFGAVLMERPALVADCVAAMIAAQPLPVTVKCRIGVDDQIPEAVLPAFLETVAGAGVAHFIIHARKAWLQGLSPKENRQLPPLDHALVLTMKRMFPALAITINGGITSLDQAQAFLAQGMDGVMVGRAAYHDPWAILGCADAVIWGAASPFETPAKAGQAMRPLIVEHLRKGGRLHQFTRHMLGLFAGRPGARAWRRTLSEGAGRPGAGIEVFDAALAQVMEVSDA